MNFKKNYSVVYIRMNTLDQNNDLPCCPPFAPQISGIAGPVF